MAVPLRRGGGEPAIKEKKTFYVEKKRPLSSKKGAWVNALMGQPLKKKTKEGFKKIFKILITKRNNK